MKVRGIMILAIIFWSISKYGIDVVLSVVFAAMFVGLFGTWIFVIAKAIWGK